MKKRYFEPGRQSLTLSRGLMESLESCGRSREIPLPVILLTAYQVLLSRYSAEKSIELEICRKNGKGRGTSWHLLADLSGNPGFGELLDRVVQTIQTVKPLKKVFFAKAAAKERNKPSSEGFILCSKKALPDWSLNLQGTKAGLMISMECNHDPSWKDMPGRVIQHFKNLLEGIVTHPDLPIADLPFLTPSELHQLLMEWNDTYKKYPQDKCIHDIFEEQVKKTPDRVAVVYEKQNLTYAELNRRTNQLAHFLRRAGVGSETLVAICLNRSSEMLIAVLGVLKAGGAYVPLDPFYPKERLSFMLNDSKAQVLLTESTQSPASSQQSSTPDHLSSASSRFTIPVSPCTIICLDTEWKAIAGQDFENPNRSATGENLAYVIYTSGSTGRPKGVQIPHKALVNLVNSMMKKLEWSSEDRLLSMTNLSFDMIELDLYLPLITGACLEIGDQKIAKDGERLGRRLVQGSITIMQGTPVTWRLLLAAGWSGVKGFKLICGGEAMPPDLAVQLLKSESKVWNLYGPTETTVWSTSNRLVQGEILSIGRPIDNTQIFILDSLQYPVPMAMPGELYIGGVGLSRGYWDRPNLTAEKFIPNPYSPEPGARLYKTGDLARYLPDGNIEFLGRIDQQIKIRGYRIELGEIESVLSGHPQIRENVVVTQSDAGANQRLVGYIVAKDGNPISTHSLQSFLKQQLPDYMVPSVFVMLDKLPVSPNGKVDRKALPTPDDHRPELARAFIAPQTPLEQELAQIWAEILGVARVGVDDDFFELGGHSLLATRVISKLRQAFQVELPIRILFEETTIKGLAKRVEDARKKKRGLAAGVIEPVNRDRPLPLSFAQQRLWFLDQLEPGLSVYNIPFALYLKGKLDLFILKQSLYEIVKRHEVLRTIFQTFTDRNEQVITLEWNGYVAVVNLESWGEIQRKKEISRLMEEEARKSFDLRQGPLLRAMVLTASEEENILILNIHHIVFDGWSIGILIRELSVFYEAYAKGKNCLLLPELPIQYVDFTIWQRKEIKRFELKQQLNYWKKKMQDAPAVLALPVDHPRPPIQSHRGSGEEFTLSLKMLKALEWLARKEGATLFMILLAAFKALLYRYTFQTDMVVGTPIAGRNRAEIENLIGFFVNTLVLRTDMGGRPTFKELLARVKETALEAYEHQDLPFEKIVEELQPERDLSRSPLFQVMFAMENIPDMKLESFGGLESKCVELRTGTSMFDLTLSFVKNEHGLTGWVEYSTELFNQRTILRLIDHFKILIEGIISNPEMKINELPLLTKTEEKQILVEWNNVQKKYAHDKCIHALFENQVNKTPDTIAVVYEEHSLSYAKLNGSANQLAHCLGILGVKPETMVGICMERSIEMMIGLMGILKAGGAYIPLDPNYPKERLEFMLEDSGARILLTQSSLSSIFTQQSISFKSICLDKALENPSKENHRNPIIKIHNENLAYMIYTSGSTGSPKGVPISHGSLVNHNLDVIKRYELNVEDRVLQFASIGFDVAAEEIFPTWLSGATLIVRQDKELTSIPDFVKFGNDAELSVLNLPASYWHELVAFLKHSKIQLPTSLRLMVVGSEPVLTKQLIIWQGLAPNPIRWCNAYGITETTITTMLYDPYSDLKPQITQFVPIGRPLSNTQIYLLDEHLRAVPVGIPAELYISGECLARGYWNNPALTAEKFIPNPFIREDSEIEYSRSALRLFKTSDRARYLEDGSIELLGRIDSQVKIRGFRIELGEVEAILGGHPDVKETAVTVWEDEQKTKRLAAYIVSHNGKGASARLLQNYLKNRLPEYMIPSAFVMLDCLPLLPNGKVDRKALPIPDKRNLDLESGYTAPRNEAEKKIATIWGEVLGLESVGIHDNFFDLGGHSLLVLRMHQKLKDVFDKEVTVRDLFRYTTIAALAQYYDPTRTQSDVVIEKAAERVLARQNAQPSDEIAIIGMAGCFPGASTVDTLWKNLQEGKESVTFFTDEELLAAGVDAEWLKDPRYVKAHAIISDIDCFDARFFGVNPREAEMMDPQQRLFLEYAWRALEDAGYDSEQYHRPIGVFAGSGENTYLPNNLYPNQEYIGINDQYQIIINNSKDFLATQVSYKLNLTGPSMTVQTACSTSLVAVYEACQSIINQKCHMALAGGISLSVPQVSGYIYTPEGILSPDGHCRPFDSKAQGTVCGQGIGLVVLKRLRDALKDGDTIHAVIKGSAINNDGARKIGYTAPSEDGQVEVITEALIMAKVNPESITYVEAHGTGTALGDPIEVAALTRSFRYHTQNKQYCALGSVKSNIGHLDTAAGIAGLIKTVLCLKNKQLVPSLHFTEPNPAIHISESPFYVNTELREWKSNGQARRAGVSSFGLGGTNAHVIVEEAPSADETDPAKTEQLIVLSAKTAEALEEASVNIAVFLGEHPDTNLADAAYTLQAGRRSFEYRRALVCTSTADAASTLETNDPERVYTFHETARHRPLYFMFPGGGSQYINMGRTLYATEILFRDIIDQCALLLQPHLGLNLLDIFYPPSGKEEAASKKLEQIEIQQPGLFVIEYALAKLWQSWGFKPQAMIGHSLGEYVAACLAGVFDLKDAVALVAARGKLMQSMPNGRMLSVALSETDLKPLLNEEMSIGTINGPSYCVVSGTIEAVAGLERHLTEKGVDHRRIHISHASHSPMMDPILKSFENKVRRVTLHPPQIPYLSNRSGTWIKSEEAMDPVYWAQHLRQTVRFADGIKVLLQEGDAILLEVGPGRTLSIFAKQQEAQAVLNSLPHPEDKTGDRVFFLNTLGRLWLYGLKVDWQGLYGKERRRKISLPTYPFERQCYWAKPTARPSRAKFSTLSYKKSNIADWFYVPIWKQAVLPISRVWEQEKTLWLVFEDDYGFGSRLVDYLEQKGQEAIIVKAGDNFRQLNGKKYLLNPGKRDHYNVLFKQIGRCPSQIVHLWNITVAEQNRAQLESLEKDLDLSFYSIVFLMQAIGEQAWPVTNPTKIGIVSNNMQSVLGDEESLYPEKAPLLGPCKIIPIEYPGVNCCSLDIVLPQIGSKTEVNLIEHLVDEISMKMTDPIVAFRGRHRWTPIYEPIRLEAKHEKLMRICQGGVYLITGGLGGMGLTLAEYLARIAQAKLILINRSSFPKREEWGAWLSTHDDQEKISCKIRKLQSIEALNSEVLVLNADVSDRSQMQTAIAQACKRFGAIQGIFHFAGVGGGGIIQLDNREAAAKVLAAKIKGALILDEIFKNAQVDIFVIASSMNSILGEAGHVDYTAANAFLDAFAQRGAVSARYTVAINWDIWQEVGMAMEIDVPENLREKHEKLLKLGMNPREGIEALRRILCSDMKQVIVSTQDFCELVNKERDSVVNTSREARQIQQTQANYPRPKLQNVYAAPSNETEEKLSTIWREFLGLEKVGIHDNFFELGGHSLLATRVISQIRKVFQIDLSIRTFLEVKTIARLAKLIEDACWIRQKTASDLSEAVEEGNI